MYVDTDDIATRIIQIATLTQMVWIEEALRSKADVVIDNRDLARPVILSV
jgi:hypothetical protein